MTKYTGVYLNQDQGDKWTAAEHDGTKWVSETKSADGDHATLGTTTDAAETDHTASGTVMKFLKGVLQTLKGILTTKIDQTTDGTTNRVVAKISQTAGENVVTLGGSLTALHTFHNAIVAAADGTAFAVEGYKTLTVYISGTSTSRTIDFKCLPPGAVAGDYRSLMGVRVSDFATATSTTGNNETWQFDVTGLTEVLMDCSAVAGGNVTVKGRAVA